MRRLPLCKIAEFFFVFTLVLILIYNFLNLKNSYGFAGEEPAVILLRSTNGYNQNSIEKIIISFVVCDSRFNESLNVVKSVLVNTKTPVHFVIFAQEELKAEFNKVLNSWRSLTVGQLDYELHSINFPEPHKEQWLNLFKKCSSQRLFIPELITHIDALIYVDTDTVFLGPPDELWNTFLKFNDVQITAMALEHNNPMQSWYPRFAKHPFYGAQGLNSGVMLMNLTRMRKFGWDDYITPVMLKWKLDIPWGDQDIINIIFHHHTSHVFELSCRYNYRSDQCLYGDDCKDATRNGIYLLHGSRNAFHGNKQPAFKAVYRAIEEYEVGTDPTKTYLPRLENYLTNGAHQSFCDNISDAFLKVPKKTLTNTNKV